MVLDNVKEYTGQHSVTFTVDDVSKNTWTDWGLIPSSRHSEPVNSIWSQVVNVTGVNGQEDLIRKYPSNSVNSYSKLKNALKNDNRDKILSDEGYDIYQPSSGSLSFIIADQTVSFFKKQHEILNFLHNRIATMVLQDDPDKVYLVRVTVDSFSNGDSFSSMSISYSILDET